MTTEPAPHPKPKPLESVPWPLKGAVLGGFLGLLVGKFALGLIFGFFAGIMFGATKRKTAATDRTRTTEKEARE